MAEASDPVADPQADDPATDATKCPQCGRTKKRHAPEVGRPFFFLLIVALVLLAYGYMTLHRAHPERQWLSVGLLERVTEARAAARAGNRDELHAVLATMRQDLEPPLFEAGMLAEADALADAVKSALQATESRASKAAKALEAARAAEAATVEAEEVEQTAAEERTKKAEEALQAATDADAADTELADGFLEALTGLDSLIVRIAEKERPEPPSADAGSELEHPETTRATESTSPALSSTPYFWRSSPWRYVEIFLWALAGVLVHLIVTTGVYMKDERFWAGGVYQHVALLISVPLLTFVWVSLLSMVTIKVNLVGDQSLGLDMSDPRILVALSFLVASAPWKLWDFLKSAADRVLSRAGDADEAGAAAGQGGRED